MTEVRYRNFWGESKRADLLASLDQQPEDFEASYQIVDPRAENRFAFRPRELGVTYQSWPTVRELCEAEPFSGAQEMRKGRLMGVDRAELEARMTRYADPSRNLAQLIADGDGPADTTDQFDAERARSRLLAAGPDGQFQIRRYALHPFDNLWCAWTPVASLWNRPRPELAREVDGRNRMFITRMVAERPHEQHPMIMTAALPDYHLLRPNVVAVPIMLTPAPARGDLLDEAVAAEPRANLSARARRYLADLGLADPDADQTVREAIWFHALAIGYSPAWLADSGEAIRQDWPRVPLPATAELLLASADLGRQVADLLDPDVPVPGVTTGSIRPELRTIAVLAKRDGSSASGEDMALTAGWGHFARGSVVMPGRGLTAERGYVTAEAACAAHKIAVGEQTLDVFLNAKTYWRNVPAAVWDFTIGGYQVVKKWLSYRERPILGRPIGVAEARHLRDTVRRLAALRILAPSLDANYVACAAVHPDVVLH